LKLTQNKKKDKKTVRKEKIKEEFKKKPYQQKGISNTF